MKVIDGVKYVTKDDIIKAAAKVSRNWAEEAREPFMCMLPIMASAEICAELFPKEDEENKEDLEI